MHEKNQKSFSTLATMSDSNRVTKDCFTMCKNTMLKEAQTSIALLLQEIQNHRFPKYPTQKKIIQPKTKIKFAANREVQRTRVVGKTREVNTETPSTKTAVPFPVSMEKRITGGAVAKKRKKVVVLPTETSSRPPKRNNGKNISLNEDSFVLPSDDDSDQSHYSQSETTYRYSDGSTESEASEEEGKDTKNETTDILERPIENEQLVQKVENVIEQNPGSTTKQSAIGQLPRNEETVCRPVVEIVRKHEVQ
jgi:hypothetical protein